MSTPSDTELIVSRGLLREWTLPEAGISKHDRGHVLVIGGARSTPGAALLAGLASLRVGAGVLAMAVEDSVSTALAVNVPEASVIGVCFDEPGPMVGERLADLDSALLGPGLDDPASTTRLMRVLAERAPRHLPVVLDAFALGVLGTDRVDRSVLPDILVLTPNHEEAERLLADGRSGTDLDDPSAVAAALADQYTSVVAFQRHIADPEGGRWFVPDGNAGLGTSGSGDVLAGAITGLLARGATAAQAACWATYLHAVAGDRLAASIGRLGYLAREIVDELPAIITQVEAA